MSNLRSNKRAIFIKSEDTYGVDSVPTGAEAILVRNLDFTPFDGEVVQRNLVRSFFGNSPQLVAAVKAGFQLEVEAAGSGAAGVAPAYAPLIKACGFAESITTITISSLTRVGAVATAATASPHGLAVGDVVKVSGATETEYNKNAVVATVADSTHFTYAVTGTPATPATGTPVINTGVVYTPVTDAIGSASAYYNNDGVFHKALGVRGNMEFMLSARQIPFFRFTFTALYTAPVDAAVLTANYSAFMDPQVATTEFTSGFSLFGYSGVLSSLSLNMANEVNYRNLIGAENVQILNRKPAGSLLVEAPLIASKDFFAIAAAGSQGALAITHGSVGGNKIALSVPNVSLGNPQYQDDNGIQMLNLPYVAAPSDTGNDELTLTFK